MHGGPIKDQRQCVCVYVGIHEGNPCEQRLGHMKEGLAHKVNIR